MQVLGVGFGRTGTLSLKLALECLGYSPCYHMTEVLNHPHHDAIWLRAVGGEDANWDALFAGFAASVDWPAAYFWRELCVHFPAAKIILTVRDEHAWYESIQRTIFAVLNQDDGADGPSVHRQMTRRLILERVFVGRFNDAGYVRAVFLAHNREVQATIPANRLLVYAPGDGWAPLCQFLALPVPSTPYPTTNSKRDFRAKYLT